MRSRGTSEPLALGSKAISCTIREAGRVLRLLLNYEAAQRRHELLSSQLKTLEQQQRVARVSYRLGRGSTSQILGMSDKRDLEEIRFAGRLVEKIVNAEIEKDEAVRERMAVDWLDKV